MKSLAADLFSLLRGTLPSSDGWRQIISLADRTHTTLHLHGLDLPREVEQQVAERWAKNAIRRSRLREAFLKIEHEFTSRGIPYVLLKGFTHETGFGLPAGTRFQSDLDFLVPPNDRASASEVLTGLGYRPHGPANLSAEHDRPWVLPSNWTWRGDYFDPDMPLPVELHDSIWSAASDRIQCPGLDQFWDRRVPLSTGGMQVQAFQEVDRIAFAALHALRHVLRNDARPAHVLELARLMETRAQDQALWARWSSAQAPEARQLQAVAFRFAEEWFGCPLSPVVARECASLPPHVQSWLSNFAWSPVENLSTPNKDVLWLHLALLKSPADRWKVAVRRLLPLRAPHEKFDARLSYHASAFFPALRDGARWWWTRTLSSTISHTSD